MCWLSEQVTLLSDRIPGQRSCPKPQYIVFHRLSGTAAERPCVTTHGCQNSYTQNYWMHKPQDLSVLLTKRRWTNAKPFPVMTNKQLHMTKWGFRHHFQSLELGHRGDLWKLMACRHIGEDIFVHLCHNSRPCAFPPLKIKAIITRGHWLFMTCKQLRRG